MRRIITALLGLLALAAQRQAAQPASPLPVQPESLKFAVVGDNGTGDRPEFDVGQQMATAHGRFPFDTVLMLGDNLYGRQQRQDFVDKFERPYGALLREGVLFYATLGNHDNPNNRFYRNFNMGGEHYYTFARLNVRFVVLDSNQMDPKQRAWLDDVLQKSREDWKVCYFHHPIYSDGGRHGSDVALRVVLEPAFVRYGVNVVFAGHDHVYERLKPQKGIAYFVAGSGGALRRGDVKPSATTAAYFDQDNAFMLIEVGADDLFFEAVSRTGAIVDSGVIHRLPRT
jgi:3',5'-cyclic AMP phosphodiesterase CpdA